MNIIDRFEEDYAVIETDGGMINVARAKLPENAAEGDVLEFTDGVWTIDESATEERRRNAASKLRRLLGND